MAALSKPEYDFPTAVTFFLAGLGVGAIVALAFSAQVKPAEGPRSQAAQAQGSHYSPAL
jgi:hypothetical protein